MVNSTILRLGVISFFADVAGEMLYPVTPIFLTTVLGASMISIGLIEGCADAVASVLKVYAGSWSDRIGRRKPFVVAGYFLAAVAKPLIGIATGWPQVLLARSLDRFGKGLRTAPRDAMLSESVAPEFQGRAFGWHRAIDTLGAAVGPLIAIAFLAYVHDDLRSIFFLALIPGLIAVVITLTIREKKQPARVEPLPHWKWGALPPRFRNYLVAWTVFSLANSSDVFLLLKVNQVGGSTIFTIVLYCFYNLVYAALSPLLGKWSDRVPKKVVLSFGLVVFALVYLGFSVVEEIWQCWLLFGFYGVYMAATEGVGKALAVELFDPKLRATAVGILGASTGIATIIASTVAGAIWDQWGSTWAFVYSAAGAFLGAILLQRKTGS